jgi:hypothetical protein
VYIIELREGGGRWQISSNGGRFPVWSDDGRELYYITLDWDFIAVPITTSGKFAAGKPVTLFNKGLNLVGFIHDRYAVTKDKNKFIMTVPVAATRGGEFTVVVNWTKEIRGH